MLCQNEFFYNQTDFRVKYDVEKDSSLVKEAIYGH